MSRAARACGWHTTMRPPPGHLSIYEGIINDPSVVYQPADTMVVYGWAGDSTPVGLGFCTPLPSVVRADREM
jgi:hypothetical protein